jgi:hypothetical protein
MKRVKTNEQLIGVCMYIYIYVYMYICIYVYRYIGRDISFLVKRTM